MKYSLVIPVKDEEDNLLDLFSEIKETMATIREPWETIFIDDGSRDKSLSILRELQKNNPQIKLLTFEKNFGQSSAFAAGFQKASGDYVITLDADRQNDPKDIPKLIQAIQESDMVVGWRVNRKDTFQKRMISKLSNAIRSRLLQDHMHDTGCSLKIFKRSSLERIKIYDGMHRFFPALFIIEGFLVKEIPVSHRPRTKGKTKYHFFNRSIRPFLDLFAVYWMRKRHLRYRIK